MKHPYAPQNQYMDVRPQLQEKLQRIARSALTVVEAPLGYGKATALQAYLREAGGMALWQTVTDCSPEVFWFDFCRLFRSLCPACAQRLAQLGFPARARRRRQAVALLAEAALPGDVFFVVEESELRKAAAVDRWLLALAAAEIAGLHIVVVTSFLPDGALARELRRGGCLWIGKRDLALDAQDVARWYERCGIALKAEEAAAMQAATEGWAAALSPQLRDFFSAPAAELPPRLRALLEGALRRCCAEDHWPVYFALSAFDGFSAAQAAFFARGRAPLPLSAFRRGNALVDYDAAAKRYRLHGLLRAYLRAELARLDEARRSEIHARIGAWYLRADDPMAAAAQFERAGDWERLLQSLESDRAGAMDGEDGARLVGYFARVPAAVLAAHPIARLQQARVLLLCGEAAAAAAVCAAFERFCAALPDEAERRRLLGELEIMRALASYNRSDAMASRYRRAQALLDGRSRIACPRGNWSFGAPSVLYLYHRESGALRRETAQLEECLQAYRGISGGNGCGGDLCMRAEAAYYAGDYADAEADARRALVLAEARGQTAVSLCADFLLARLALARGDSEQALGRLRRMRERVCRPSRQAYRPVVELCDCFVRGCLGKGGETPEWIDAGNWQRGCLRAPARGYCNLVFGKVLLLRRQYAKLLGFAKAFAREAERFSNALGRIYISVYESAAHAALGDGEAADAALERALALALPDRLALPFVENGALIETLLRRCAKGRYAAFARRCLALHRLYAKRPLGALTARERRVACLVAEGLTNYAVARRLHLAEVTVKKILQAVYGKLGVKSRAALPKRLAQEETREER